MTVFEGKRPLLTAFRAGERAALEVVYMHYVDDVFDLARFGFMLSGGRRVPGTTSPDLQRELLHDVFVRAFSESARLRYDGARPYRPYLMRIACNVIVDAWRKRGTLPADVNEEEIIDPVSAQAHDEDPDWQRLLAETRAFSATLDEESRRFVTLRFERDLPQRDVAAEMRVTRRRVRTLEARLRQGLLDHLTRLGLAD